MSGNIYDWSVTASDNDSADGDINWKEGMNSKVVNNSAREMMARVAEFLLDLGGQGTIGGTANAITLTLNSAFTGLKSGLVCSLQPTADNTAAVTLNVNGIGAKAIRKFDSTGEIALASGDLQAGNFYLLVYDLNANSAAGAWICLNPTPAVYQASSSKLTDIAALAVTDGNVIVGNGTTWVAESGATARTSLGLGTAATVDTGTSGAVVPLLNGANTWSSSQAFGGINLGSSIASGVSDLSKHIALYSTSYGFSVTSGTINYVAPAGSHAFYINNNKVVNIGATSVTINGTLTVTG
ncbi:MAG: hypothetical protein ACTHJQ_22620 [Rhizobiaceae bacterium]